MRDIRSTLKSADPIAREGGASSTASERMRRGVQASIPNLRPARRPLFPALAAAMLFFAVGAGWLTSRAVPPQTASALPHASVSDAPETPGGLQLQYFTPGGTRLLWTLHPKLETR